MDKERANNVGQEDRHELDILRADKRRAEIKLRLLEERYLKEVALFHETQVEHILKNNGVREYFERHKDQSNIKDRIIKNLKQDLEYKTKEVAELHDRCKEAERKSKEYLKAWKEAQMARVRLDGDRQSTRNLSVNTSSASKAVPPPPHVEEPTLEEILNMTPISQDDNSYTGMNSSIPPPPDVEVPLIDILKGSGDRKAFEQEKGQFMCRVYFSIDSESSQDVLNEIVELVETEQSKSSSEAFLCWISLNKQTDDSEKSDFHITLLRGHRALHYHQIEPLLTSVEALCRNLRPSSLCLDKLRLFSNHEETKQFLTISTRNSPSSVELTNFINLKQKLRDVVDQFADRVTGEDETQDTIPHVSLMYRKVQRVQTEDEISQDLEEIENLCNERIGEYICLVNVDAINLAIGKKVYSFKF